MGQAVGGVPLPRGRRTGLAQVIDVAAMRAAVGGCAERRLRGPCAHASEVGARVACRSQAPGLDALRGQA